MRRIVHLSDVHFGRHDPIVVEGLLDDVAERGPDLCVVSGDLTQRARRSEFRAARRFLEGLPKPRIVVPGNHDIPLWDIPRRFLLPLRRYRRHITRDLAPFFADEEIAALGLNTARSLTWKDGRLSLEQIALIRERFDAIDPETVKVLVTHHPFVAPTPRPRPTVVGRAQLAIDALQAVGADLVLSGHWHLGFSGDVRAHYLRVRRSIVVVQAGTACSTRARGEPNSYNVVDVSRDRIEVRVRVWLGRGFVDGPFAGYDRREGRWRRDPATESIIAS